MNAAASSPYAHMHVHGAIIRDRNKRLGPAFLKLFKAVAYWLIESLRRRLRRERTIRALYALSDATLKDIGLRRSEIVSVASGLCRTRRPH